ncbi:hypothetical protein FE782_26425 [Paenibacillus antri]|uniref:RCC1-like domain-containing protein n=1 Tax=Paenibacillus antri TaxID=2582848 RepID=A0A5R9G077_9BACL|nr:hypothetical protein [Paenibacillus antri]TLS49171.1 hypothetical protein FE782_26425 [Paenibacillus antri]
MRKHTRVWKMASSLLAGALLLQSFLPVPSASAKISDAPGFKQVEAGYYMTSALDENGGVWSWGWRPLGTNMEYEHTLEQPLPTPVRKLNGTPLTGIAQIAVGESHTVALGFDGKVWTWGANDYGQLGDGTYEDSFVAKTIYIPPEAGTVTKVEAGAYFSMALTSGTKVYSWGRNDRGQLGNRNTGNTNVPVLVEVGYMEPLEGIADIQAGNDYALALREESVTGVVYAWGDSSRGQLGTGISAILNPAHPYSEYPVEVSGLGTNVRSIHTDKSADHSIAITDEFHVYGWGENADNQLTDSEASSDWYYTFPVRLPELEALKPNVVATGTSHTLVLDELGNVQGIGTNYKGELAHDTYNATWYNPTVVLSNAGTDITYLAAGQYNSFAVFQGGVGLGWGDNSSNLIGPDAIGDWRVTAPTPLADLIETGYEVRAKIVDYRGGAALGCVDASLYFEMDNVRQLGYAGADGVCVFTDIPSGTSPEFRHNYFGELSGYHSLKRVLGPIAADADIGTVYALPTWMPTAFTFLSADFLSIGDSDPDIGKLSGRLQWDASRWTGDMSSYRAFYVNATGESLGDIGVPFEMNRIDFSGNVIPAGAVGIQIEVTITGSSGASGVYTLPHPFPIVDNPVNLPKVHYADDTLTIQPSSDVGPVARLRMIYVAFHGEGTTSTPIGEIPATSPATIPVDEFPLVHPVDHYLVQLLDGNGQLAYEMEVRATADAAFGLRFLDEDNETGEIGGRVAWNLSSAAMEYGISGYEVFLGDKDGLPIGEAIATASSGALEVAIPMNTAIAPGRHTLVLRTMLAPGGFQDDFFPLYDAPFFPENPKLSDADAMRGNVKATLQWTKAPGEPYVDEYIVQSLLENGQIGSDMARIPVGSTGSYEIELVEPFVTSLYRDLLITVGREGQPQALAWRNIAITDNTSGESVEAVVNADLQAPSVVSFNGNQNGSMLDARLSWEQVNGEIQSVYGYQLYFLDENEEKVSSYFFLRHWNKETLSTNVTVPNNIAIPSGAAKIGIYAVNSDYEESATAAIVDLPSITPTPGLPHAMNLGFFDIDPSADRIAGTVMWSPAGSETGLASYDVLFADSLGAPVGSPIGTVTEKAGAYRFPLPTEGVAVPPGAVQILVRSNYATGSGIALLPLTDHGSEWELEANARMLIKPTSTEPLSLVHVFQYMNSGQRLPNFAGPDGFGKEDVQFLLRLLEPRLWPWTPPLV